MLPQAALWYNLGWNEGVCNLYNMPLSLLEIKPKIHDHLRFSWTFQRIGDQSLVCSQKAAGPSMRVDNGSRCFSMEGEPMGSQEGQIWHSAAHRVRQSPARKGSECQATGYPFMTGQVLDWDRFFFQDNHAGCREVGTPEPWGWGTAGTIYVKRQR